MALNLSGLASGFDWNSVVDQLTEVERAPERRMSSEQDKIDQRNNSLGSVKTQLTVLQSRINALKDPALYDKRTSTVSATSVATATATATTPLGSYRFAVQQLATAASLQGTSDIGGNLSATYDYSSVSLANAPFSTAVTAGTFSVNGKRIDVTTDDTLATVFDRINSATEGAVTASYNVTDDTIELSSGSEIILGSATDTSNFLQAARLANNGTGAIASSSKLGAVNPGKTLDSANFATALTDGGSGAGEFKINGVSITFDSSKDTLNSVISRINSSDAGVIAAYDAVNDRMVLTNKSTGDIGVGVEDVTGNFIAATGLGAGSIQHGKNLLYTLNGGGTLTSQSNTITEASSGIPGLSASVLTEGSFNVDVAVDSKAISTALNDFITEYNKTQSIINSSTASTTDSKGKVTAGILAGDSDASAINSQLRALVNGDVSVTGSLIRLDSLGFSSNGNDDSIAATDATELDDTIATKLDNLKDFFTNADNGFATRFATYLDGTIGDSGTLVKHQASLTKQSKDIDTQIADMEKLVLSNRQRLIDSFVAMETAQQSINSQLSYLNKTFA